MYVYVCVAVHDVYSIVQVRTCGSSSCVVMFSVWVWVVSMRACYMYVYMCQHPFIYGTCAHYK